MDSAPSLSQSAPDTLAAKVRVILRAVQGVLGAWAVEPVLALLLHRRISTTIGKIERMLVRFRAGTLWRVGQRQAAPRQARSMPKLRLPRRFAWLVQMAGHQAACFGVQLQTVLNTPEMVEFLAASPQAMRILRPMCRALAIELPWTVDKAPEMKPRKPRKPRPKPEPFRIPLPRGVLAAARRQGFGKMR